MRESSWLMPSRLINFVLLFAYGLPGLCGQGLHGLLPHGGEHSVSGCCHSGHCHAPAPPACCESHTGSADPGSNEDAESSTRLTSWHNPDTCSLCRFQRSAQSFATPKAPLVASEDGAPMPPAVLPVVDSLLRHGFRSRAPPYSAAGS